MEQLHRGELLTQLEKLSNLKEKGIINSEVYEIERSKVLIQLGNLNNSDIIPNHHNTNNVIRDKSKKGFILSSIIILFTFVLFFGFMYYYSQTKEGGREKRLDEKNLTDVLLDLTKKLTGTSLFSSDNFVGEWVGIDVPYRQNPLKLRITKEEEFYLVEIFSDEIEIPSLRIGQIQKLRWEISEDKKHLFGIGDSRNELSIDFHEDNNYISMAGLFFKKK